MTRIDLDYDAVSSQLGDYAETVLQSALFALQEFARDRIRQLSSAHLSIPTHTAFVRAIVLNRGPTNVVITIEDPKLAALDTGVQSFDIKRYLLASPKAKKGRAGPYIDVPFQHKTTKRGIGRHIPSKAIRTTVRKAMQKAAATGHGERLFAKQRGAPITKITDMVITPLGHAVVAHTFRRVSGNSKPDSWIYPGREGMHVFDTVAKEVEEIKDGVILEQEVRVRQRLGGKK